MSNEHQDDEDLPWFIKWMQTEFFEEYEDAISKTDAKAIKFWTEYLIKQLKSTDFAYSDGEKLSVALQTKEWGKKLDEAIEEEDWEKAEKVSTALAEIGKR